IRVGRALAQVVDTAMYVRVLSSVVVLERVDYLSWFLAGGGVIEVDQRFPVDRCVQNGKVVPDARHIERLHPGGCRSRRGRSARHFPAVASIWLRRSARARSSCRRTGTWLIRPRMSAPNP